MAECLALHNNLGTLRLKVDQFHRVHYNKTFPKCVKVGLKFVKVLFLCILAYTLIVLQLRPILWSQPITDYCVLIRLHINTC